MQQSHILCHLGICHLEQFIVIGHHYQTHVPVFLPSTRSIWIGMRKLHKPDQGPVVQSVVSLTSSLRVISLTVLADSVHNILIFFAGKIKATHIFSAKNFSIFA